MSERFLATVAIFAAIFLPAANANPFVINDERIRSLDITPQLGRGYSIMTNSFQGNCILVNETSVPSYNYDCKLVKLLFFSERMFDANPQVYFSVIHNVARFASVHYSK